MSEIEDVVEYHADGTRTVRTLGGKEMKTREELVKAVEDAKFVCADAYDAASAADAAYTSAADAADAAFADLAAYDKENK